VNSCILAYFHAHDIFDCRYYDSLLPMYDNIVYNSYRKVHLDKLVFECMNTEQLYNQYLVQQKTLDRYNKPTYLITDQPRCLRLVRHQQKADQLLSLDNYIPHVISYGCKKGGLSKACRVFFASTARNFYFFKNEIKESYEKFKSLPRLLIGPRSVDFCIAF
jgi:hypothetical protein